ncbi:CPBP family intramembrane glutamic endopeptidase [Nocardioides sp. B-3]|uniref:CPBP family intramembrane glutamic endopeptidase n=1 Tax=Nocardioides sp. B-3 TaxID=2895565 RepID=UPI00215211E7|nr:CPBP family intramembrane glutamic endopeptidase [Nocardioides sp. B-3]UUZ61233.1 CPBP family intramembrane metalloprotease [Nocardioides sp. B-3]
MVVLVGGAVLGWSLRLEPGSDTFYVATATLAVVWTLGAVASGPLHPGRIPRDSTHARPVVAPILLALLLAAVFVVGGLVVREIEVPDRQVRSVLDFADRGSIPLLLVITIVNGIAEELFFRGAAFAAIPRHPVAWTTLAYFVATPATGNVMLAFAAILLGLLCGLQRRASGGVLAPILTHVTRSVTMLFALPAIFG